MGALHMAVWSRGAEVYPAKSMRMCDFAPTSTFHEILVSGGNQSVTTFAAVAVRHVLLLYVCEDVRKGKLDPSYPLTRVGRLHGE